MVNSRQKKSLNWTRIGIGVFLIILSLFCFICEVGAFGSVGGDVKRFLIGSFGLSVFAYSLVLTILGFAITFGLNIKMKITKVLLVFLMFLTGILALHSYTSSPYSLDTNYGEYLFGCYDANNTAGGVLLGVITYPLMKAISPVGSIIVFCVLFFLILFLFIYPILKRTSEINTTPSQKIKIEFGARNKIKSTVISYAQTPALIDFSKDSTNGGNFLSLGISANNQICFNKKAKGAVGYQSLEDIHEIVPKENNLKSNFTYDEKSYSKKDLAKNIAFGNGSLDDNVSKFNNLLNPKSTFDNINLNFNYNSLEFMDRINAKDNNKLNQDFIAKYNLNDDSTLDSNTSNLQPEGNDTAIFEMPKYTQPEIKFNDKFDFESLKAEESNNFAKKYDIQPVFESEAYNEPETNDVIEAEVEKKEVVKPKVVHHIDVSLPKEEDLSKVNTGILGALNSSEDEDVIQEKHNDEFISSGYNKVEEIINSRLAAYPSSQNIKKEFNEVERSGYTPIENTSNPKMPYAFSNTSVYEEKKQNKTFTVSNIQNDQSVTTKSANDLYLDEQKKIAKQKAKEAIKEIPEIGLYERQLMEEEGYTIPQTKEKKPRKVKEEVDPIMRVDGKRVVEQSIEEVIEQNRPRLPYIAPTIDLLRPPANAVKQNVNFEEKENKIVRVLNEFSIQTDSIEHIVGPTFTMFKVKVTMPKGKTIGSITSLEKDFQMRLPAESVRIIAPIPGEDAIGIEVPNDVRRNVNLSEILMSEPFKNAKNKATFALGENINGDCRVVEIGKMPHGLIAGATGQGKSCCINALIISLLYKCSPDDLRFILIDPKAMEFSVYKGLPHLLIDEIITDADKAIRALNWAIAEMDRRKAFLGELHYRDFEDYNAQCEKDGNPKMPRILIVVDEFADLMSFGKKNVEQAIDRIARLARAVGINLVLATQRPSVDVVSGTIKNNFPTRVACKVTSSFDSKTVLDQVGADKLLGYGDLLLMAPGKAGLERMQGAFVEPDEVKNVVDFVKEKNIAFFDNSIRDKICKDEEEERQGTSGSKVSSDDIEGKKIPEFYKALELGIQLKNTGNPNMSISLLQRKLGLGFAKAGRVFDMLDTGGFLTVDENNKKIKYVNITTDELNAIKIADGVDDEE